jgi:agmatinase
MTTAPYPDVLRRYASPEGSFLAVEGEEHSWANARYRILPVPYEATVSYGSGAKDGPAAIIEASAQIELFDAELDLHPGASGIHTLPAVEPDVRGPEAMTRRLREIAEALCEPDRVTIALGGEHSITPPLALPYLDAPDTWVLCVDAHADLRKSYQGSPYSHACAMHTIARTGRLVQVGIRALSEPERDLARELELTMVMGWDLDADGRWLDRVFEALGPRVYLSLDVDGLDPTLMPATGTPVPGGLTWPQFTALVDRLGREREVVAADVVELAPAPGLHAPTFTAALAVYRIIGAIEAGRKNAGR